jgi:4-amino-4-deoxy-L-arabinose transferase-like glycosyltransferase
MDDLREAEVALEMEQGGDFIVPHLAGLPFVEKPPGFPALVALAYRAAGGPGAGAGRLVSAFFAGAALLGTYLLGRRALNVRVGLAAACLVGLSPLFCRVSHEILLDNALVASVVFAQFFLWESMDDRSERERRWAAWAAGLCLGFSLLVKGFVGPSLVFSGLAVHAASSRSWEAARACLRPGVVIGFLVPALLWMAPFVLTAEPALLRGFFIDNHLARFTRAFDGHARPFYFYLETLPYKLGWATLLVLPAAAGALKGKGKVDLYFLSLAAGPVLLLSLSRGKEAIYLLPAYPALALLGAGWLDRVLRERRASGRAVLRILFGAAALCAVVMVIVSWRLGLSRAPAAVAAGFLVLALGVLFADRTSSREECLLLATPVLWGLACLLWVSGPVADREDAAQEWPPVADRVLAEAGDGEIILHRPTDELRGALGFVRRRPAREARNPEEAVALMRRNPKAIVVDYGGESEGMQAAAFTAVETLRIPFKGKTVSVWRALPDPALED